MRFIALFWWLLLGPVAAAQEAPRETAAVEVDGKVLFRVRGVEALPPAQRAGQIAARISALAADRSFQPETLHVEERGAFTDIASGDIVVMRVIDIDAAIEGLDRALLAPVYRDRIRRAVVEYREERTRARLIEGATRAAAAIAIAVVFLAVLLWLLRRSQAALQRFFDQRVEMLAAESRRILRIEHLWQALRGALGLVRALALLLLGLALVQYVLAQFPWTRHAAARLLEYVSTPLVTVAKGLLGAIPNLLFLAILFFLTRYVMTLARLYFDALQRGKMQLRDFDPEWAAPTFNVVRILMLAMAIMIAYPYIPGSNSEAFKGLSLLAGVMLSLSSTSAIANVVAGYMILFRRAFRLGDRVKIGDVMGAVTEMRLQVTHLRTVKNEEVTIPNSLILSSEVTNYSKPAREGRLILHTEVGIGYETPWRQVEALLIEAACRTPGLLAEPPPFVLQKKLGDFAITYEINAYSDRTEGMLKIYADLHRNILDRFNEHGVQIMTPAYEGDPETSKIVAKDRWFAAPAVPEHAPPGSRVIEESRKEAFAQEEST